MKNSFRCLAAVAMMFTASLSANAQFQTDRESAPFHLGVHGGLTLSSFSGDGEFKSVVFPTASVHLDLQLGSNPLFLGTGVSFVEEGAKFDVDRSYSGSPVIETRTTRRETIHIPAVIGYHINTAPKMFINPYGGLFGGFCMGGSYNEGLRWGNFGLRLGCGMNFGRMTFDISYDLGLFDVDDHFSSGSGPYGVDGVRTGSFFATVGYNILGDW